jgi:hypothetical protein
MIKSFQSCSQSSLSIPQKHEELVFPPDVKVINYTEKSSPALKKKDVKDGISSYIYTRLILKYT